MKDVTDAFHSLGCWSSIGSFGFNTDILTTNPMNPSAVLFFFFFFSFVKGSVCKLFISRIVP